MNDNEIMKSLDACDNCFCENCSYKSKTIYCREELIKDALSLIRRQKAEIERLKGSVITNNVVEISKIRKTAKSEAIKEFAEKLKDEANDYDLGCGAGSYSMVGVDEIDTLVKEMVGVKKMVGVEK